MATAGVLFSICKERELKQICYIRLKKHSAGNHNILAQRKQKQHSRYVLKLRKQTVPNSEDMIG